MVAPEPPKKILGFTKQQFTMAAIVVTILIIVFFLYKYRKSITAYVSTNFRSKKKKKSKDDIEAEGDSEDGTDAMTDSQDSLGMQNEDLAEQINALKHEADE